MAKLSELMSDLELLPNSRTAGRKRRAWLEEEQDPPKKRGNKPAFNREQDGRFNGEQNGFNGEQNRLVNGEQNGGGGEADPSKLKGLQKRILEKVAEICKKNGFLETGPIETNDIAHAVSASYESTKVSIKRLIKKGLIIRGKGERGKYGKLNLAVSAATRRAMKKGWPEQDALPKNRE